MTTKQSPAQTQPRVIRVFVSSTFRDMQAERDHLVTVVFPELRERLERLGLELYDVDLRWGVPKIGVDGEKANSWDYCKQWIERVEPFFISLLGQRYGWTPPESEIHDEQDRIAYKGLSITEMEIRHAVFSGKLSQRNFFYFRQAVVPEESPPEIYREFVDPEMQVRLLRLKEEIAATKRPVRLYDCRWTGTEFTGLDAFGRMVLEDLWSGVLRDERYVSKEAWRSVLGHDPDDDPLYTDESSPILPKVWDNIVETAKPAPRNALDAETEQMVAFAGARLRWFCGRERELNQLSSFVNDNLRPEASRVCVVRAVAGQGKSALLAKLAENLKDSSHLVVNHFVGATERGTDTRTLLERLDQELERNGISAPAEAEHKYDLESLHKRFAARLEQYDGNRWLVLMIDAVNQLGDNHELSWLPKRLGPSVRIVLSTVYDPAAAPESPEGRVLSALLARQPEVVWVNLQALDEDDVRNIVQRYLVEYCKELDQAQIETICRMEQARKPLYLLVMLNELRTLGGNDMNKLVPQLISRMKEKYPDTVSLFEWVLERLEVFGKEAVQLWCTYLALGRVGMSSRELSELLAHKLGADAARTSLLIERGLRRYLQQRGAQLDFFHSQLREAVQRRYLRNLQVEQLGHWHLANYFLEQADPLGNATWTRPLPRPLTELSYHLVRGNNYKAFSSLYSDSAYLDKVCFACDVRPLPEGLVDYNGVFVLIDDVQDALRFLKNQKEKDFTNLRNYLQAISDVLIDRGGLLRKQPRAVAQELANYLEPVSKPATDLHKSATKLARDGLLIKERIRTAPSIPCHTAEITALVASPSGRHFLSGGSDGYVGCWQIDQPRPLWFIRAHKNEVTSVSFSPDGQRGLSTGDDGTVFLWEIEQGRSQQLFNELGDANKTIQWPYAFGGFLDNNTLFMIRNGDMKFELNTARQAWHNSEISQHVGRHHQRYMDLSTQAGVIAVGNSEMSRPHITPSTCVGCGQSFGS